MSNPSETPKSLENKHFEIIHLSSYDVILNNDADSNTLSQLRSELGDDEKVFSFTKDKENDDFYIKTRGLANSEIVKDLRGGRKFSVPNKVIYAFNSLTNELGLASKVKSVVEAEELQSLIRSFGFAEIRMIRPLAGIINKISGEKMMVYPLVQGYSMSKTYTSEIKGLKAKEEDIKTITEKLIGALKTQGIEPYDLNPWQWIISIDSAGFILNLIDIEGYVRS